MQLDNTRVRRSLLQLAQATYAVLEREIPKNEGVPINGPVVLRRSRWHGGKASRAITAFDGVTTTTMGETMGEMIRLGFIRRHSGSGSADPTGFGISCAARSVSQDDPRSWRIRETLDRNCG